MACAICCLKVFVRMPKPNFPSLRKYRVKKCYRKLSIHVNPPMKS